MNSKEKELKTEEKNLLSNCKERCAFFYVDNYSIEALIDFGFKYDSKKNQYDCDGVIVDIETRLIYCKSSYNLAPILRLYRYGLIEVR